MRNTYLKLAVLGGFALVLLANLVPTTQATPVPDRKAGKDGPHQVTTIAGGIIIDPADNAAYVMNKDGGIDALDLKTGKLLWTAEQKKGEVCWPIGVVDNRLVVRMRDPQRQVRIAVLAIDQKGKQLVQSGPLNFSGVEAYQWLDDQGTRSGGARQVPQFNSFVAREVLDKDKITIDWAGARGFFREKPIQVSYGTLEVDLKTCAVKVIRQLAGKPEKPLEAPALDAKANLGTCIFTVEQTQNPGKNSSPVFRVTVFSRKLKATDPHGKLLWEHPLKGWNYVMDNRPIPGARK